MSTRRCGLGFFEEEDVALKLGSCQTARALSSVSKPVPPDPDGLKPVGLWPRSELYSLRESVCAACDQYDVNHRTSSNKHDVNPLMKCASSRLVTSFLMKL